MTEEPLSPSHESLNFHVPAGQRACFFEELRPGHGRQIQAFVLAGGDVEITLNVYGPLEEGEILGETFDDPVLSEVVNAAKEKNSETQNVVIPFDASEQGHYAFCLDNRRSRFFPKFVQFDVSPLEAGSAEKAFTLSTTETQSAQQAAEGELQGALTVLHRIHKGIASIRMQQQRDRYRLDLHATMNENNYRHAFYGSLLETLIFILVAAFQIYFVRRWFASKGSRKPNRPWA